MDKQVDLHGVNAELELPSAAQGSRLGEKLGLLLRALLAGALFAMGLYLVISGQYRDAGMKVPDLLGRMGQMLVGLLLLIGLLAWFSRSRIMGTSTKKRTKRTERGTQNEQK